MKTKLVEVRDWGTCIVLLCTLMVPEHTDSVHARHLLDKTGYHGTHLVLVTWLTNNNETHYSNDRWSQETLQQAHKYIQEKWDVLSNCPMIDLAYIRGEREEPVERDRDEFLALMKKLDVGKYE